MQVPLMNFACREQEYLAFSQELLAISILEPSLFLGREMQQYSMYNLWACFEAKPEPAKPYLHPQPSEVCFTLVFTHYKTEGLWQRK